MTENDIDLAVATFKASLPDFQSFSAPGETFAGSELNYKRELSENFQAIGEALVNGTDIESSTGFLEEFRTLLNKKQESTGAPQNLASWRDIKSFFDVAEENVANQETSIDLIRKLLASADDPSAVAAAIDDFVEWLKAVGLAAGQTKIWPSLILFLWRPGLYIYIKPDFFDKALGRFGFERLGRGQKLTGDLYRRVMSDMTSLLAQLRGLAAGDFIDVQSFLWRVIAVETKMTAEEAEEFPIRKVWILRVGASQVKAGPAFSLTLDLAENDALADFYQRCVRDGFEEDDLLLLLERGSQSQVLAEGRIGDFQLEKTLLTLQITGVVRSSVNLSARTNYQLIVPGLFTRLGPHAHGAAELCREYFDRTRRSYLLTWNPEHFTAGGDGTEQGRLGYQVADRARWSCHAKRVRPGDPVYLIRLGPLWPRGLVAKGRVCSETNEARHWDEAKPDKSLRYVMVDFEGVRDDPHAPGIPIDHLQKEFPKQQWSSQVSGIEIAEEYRAKLHKLWTAAPNDDFLATLFEEYRGSDLHAKWVPPYRQTIKEIRDMQQSGATPDERILDLIWYQGENGVSRAAQEHVSREFFSREQEFLRDITQQIIRNPSSETLNAILEQWEELKHTGAANWLPRLLIHRAFAAANPDELCAVLSAEEFKTLGQLLADRYGTVFESGETWFEKNKKLRSLLTNNLPSDKDPAEFNTFCWYLLAKLRDSEDQTIAEPAPLEPSMAQNVILYGPPGTGKTYTLREQYFPRYTTQAATMSQDEWIDEILDSLKWVDVIAAALLDLGGGPVRARQLTDHPYMQAKARLQGLASLRSETVWGYLQEHTSMECENVRVASRREPEWFWKSADSRWSFAPNWEETGDSAKKAAEMLKDKPEGSGAPIKRYEFVTFHQSYSYEEFVEGIRPTLGEDGETGGNVSYALRKGVFRRMCERARADESGNRYAIFIDEINRGNISKIFGELITLVELDKREGASNAMSATLPYSGDSFSVPDNLDIYGTMNTADRSLAHIDTALRRRFSFIELMPRPTLLKPVKLRDQEIDLQRMLGAINSRIEALFDREHTIGHAYFLRGKGATLEGEELPSIFRDRIIPLLTEYFFDDWSKVRAVLADDQCDDQPEWQFVRETEVIDGLILGKKTVRNKRVFRLNRAALENPGAYVKIYDALEQVIQ